MQLTKWVHEPIWVSKVKVIQWPCSKVTQIHFQFFSLETAKPIEAKFHVAPPWAVFILDLFFYLGPCYK